MSKGKHMKRLLFIVLLGLFLFVSCEDKNGVEQSFHSVECTPSLAWLEEFLPMPEVESGGQKKLTSPASDPIEEYYGAYQTSIFLRVTVPTANSIEFMYHTMVPCSYSVKGTVKSYDNKIVLDVKSRKPAGIIPPCICNTTISGSAKLPHLDYDTVQLGETKYYMPLYEGLDTLIMIRSNVPEQPETSLLVEGLVLDEYDKKMNKVPVIIENQEGTISDTVYTNNNGYFYGYYQVDLLESDTLSVIAQDPFYGYYDTTKIAVPDMDLEYDAWTIHYHTDVKIQLGKQ